jgi:hypothetical protein
MKRISPTSTAVTKRVQLPSLGLEDVLLAIWHAGMDKASVLRLFACSRLLGDILMPLVVQFWPTTEAWTKKDRLALCHWAIGTPTIEFVRFCCKQSAMAALETVWRFDEDYKKGVSNILYTAFQYDEPRTMQYINGNLGDLVHSHVPPQSLFPRRMIRWLKGKKVNRETLDDLVPLCKTIEQFVELHEVRSIYLGRGNGEILVRLWQQSPPVNWNKEYARVTEFFNAGELYDAIRCMDPRETNLEFFRFLQERTNGDIDHLSPDWKLSLGLIKPEELFMGDPHDIHLYHLQAYVDHCHGRTVNEAVYLLDALYNYESYNVEGLVERWRGLPPDIRKASLAYFSGIMYKDLRHLLFAKK